jgi:shikimate 5-dehydrogenase
VKVAVGFSAGAGGFVVECHAARFEARRSVALGRKTVSLRQARAVFDMIYNPAETPLLKAAKAAGCRTANGLGMLLHQGAKAFEIWTGQPAPLDVMRRALEKHIYGK